MQKFSKLASIYIDFLNVSVFFSILNYNAIPQAINGNCIDWIIMYANVPSSLRPENIYVSEELTRTYVIYIYVIFCLFCR